ncbi:hypothetical protein Cni_G19589 [Canna indica]|uniref:Uncharacterized protein n=1 Tax=Canna indica TaxID=4628 RepID=A0AAQ3QJW4_9LILI|nr:hypothetical protein Cni_G19589 [Canna indica]
MIPSVNAGYAPAAGAHSSPMIVDGVADPKLGVWLSNQFGWSEEVVPKVRALFTLVNNALTAPMDTCRDGKDIE